MGPSWPTRARRACDPACASGRRAATRREFAAISGAAYAARLPGRSAAIMFSALGLGVLEGVLPLHFAERLGQGADRRFLRRRVARRRPEPGASGGMGLSPRPLVRAGVLLVGGGDHPCGGAVASVPLWVLALASPRPGSGSATPARWACSSRPFRGADRHRMVVWSQIGIIGYMLGPLAGGIVAEGAAMSTSGLFRPPRDFSSTRLSRGRPSRHERDSAQRSADPLPPLGGLQW